MAEFHFPVGIISRSKGQSSVAHAAYNSRSLLVNEKTGETHDYRRKGGLVCEGIFAPKNAPEWVRNREKLWSEVEKIETRSNSQLGRIIEIGLPHELTGEQRKWLLTDFLRENFVRQGMVVDYAIHAPDRGGDERNHHAHVTLVMRGFDEKGEWSKHKDGGKNRPWNDPNNVSKWRENWASTANRYLERFGHKARIDHRTLEAQGINREATVHLGPAAAALEKRGIRTEKGDINRGIKERNKQLCPCSANSEGPERGAFRNRYLRTSFKPLGPH